jgi:hypothetical protein
VSSEFVLACDMRFASRENTLLGQPEVGVGVNPGGGGTERLPLLVGRGRALEIVFGANDFDGDTAERYGYVNRALPDAELDGFVDVLARRIASFDRRPIAAAKNLINQVSLPSADRLLDALNAFQTAPTWPLARLRSPGRVRGLAGEQSLVERLLHGVEHLRLCFRQVAGKVTQESLFGKASFIAVEHDAGTGRRRRIGLGQGRVILARILRARRVRPDGNRTTRRRRREIPAGLREPVIADVSCPRSLLDIGEVQKAFLVLCITLLDRNQ